MPTLVHLSDLHFGPYFVEHLADLILQDILNDRPDLVIISGDFTMRGRISEYEEARAFLQKLPGPVLAIPGNHDQPLHPGALLERLTRPWSRYQRFIHSETDVAFQASGLFVIGLNDNHRILPGGIWSSSQVNWMEEELKRAAPDACKILVMHHHLLWNGNARPAGHWFPSRTLRQLASLGVELILNGHTHVPVTRRLEQGIIIAQAGTAMSGRTRLGHRNMYNRIKIDADSIQVSNQSYDPKVDRFILEKQNTYTRRRVSEIGGPK